MYVVNGYEERDDIKASEMKAVIRAKEQAVIDAALLWALCPDQGSYKDGPAVEDTCEQLTLAVTAYLGVDVSGPLERWTVDEMRAFVKSLREQHNPKGTP